MTASPLIVFDVNETLLDLDVLEPWFGHVFAAKGRMREWFAQIILYSEALSLVDRYVPFSNLGIGVLRMLSQIHGVAITEAQVGVFAGLIANLPLHSDVPAALHRLNDVGFTLVTLTNSPPGAGPDSLDGAGLGPLLARRFTVDQVRRFKPTPATYDMVSQEMGVAAADTWLVAAHTWDTIGAQSCGWKAALVTRGANAPLALDGIPQPTLIARDLTEIADALIAAQSLS